MIAILAKLIHHGVVQNRTEDRLLVFHFTTMQRRNDDYDAIHQCQVQKCFAFVVSVVSSLRRGKNGDTNGIAMRWIICLLSLFLAADAVAALPKPYDVLSRKSIFARDRVSRVPTSVSATSRSAEAVNTLPVLIGILLEDNGCVAVLETAGGTTMTELRPGQTLPGSSATVAGISLDYIELAIPGSAEPRRIYVGQNTEGTETTLSTMSLTATSSTTAPIEGDDLISRMRRRRQQEMNR